MAERKVRVRFAPSPTGALHIGGVRTALYNYLFARQHGGDLIFRIEDTDSNRFVPGAEEYILESFKWLGIHFDEGVSFGGEQGPYRQSERREIYKKYVQILLENGKAYIAFDTPEELDAKRAEIANFQYDASTRGMMRNSLTMPKEEVDALIAEGKQYVVRFKIEPNEDIHVNDLIRGEVVINSSILDDKVLYKSADELPTYHLANIVDDHLMEVSHVIRGEEWLPSAPLHVLLYRAFGWEDTMPEFAHLPLLLKPEGNGKLSKRDGDRLGFPVFPLEWHDPKSGEISSGYRESGYLPEAVINFLALLGWNPGNDQEVMSMDELIKLFDLHRCSKSGAKFDYKKGIWFNHQYIQQKPNEEIAELFLPFLKEQGVEAPFEKVVTVVGMMKDRVSFIDFVKRHKDQPFFLNLWPDDMHTPWVPEFKQKDNKSWNTEEAFIPVLAEMDKQIGRLIKALDELGLSENTIVIFTSDNGPAPSFQSARAAYLRGTKNSLYEGGIRMPFLIKYPKKIKAGQVNNESVLCAVDLYPSLCAIAGIETEKGYQGDGQNYDKVLLGKSKAKRKTDLMWDFGRNQFFKKPGNANDRSPHLAIRSGNWKLLINSDGSDAQLYDIVKDKFEKNDVAQSHPQVVAKLSKKVCKWFAENKDKGKE